METIIVSPKTKEEFKLIASLLNKMKIASKVLTDEEKEDIGLGLLMKEADRSKKVSKEQVLRKLKS